MNLSFESAEQVKKGISLDGVDPEDVRAVLRATTENVLLEVQKTFDFFKTTTGLDHITRIMVSGGAARVDAFDELLRERFDAPIEKLDPFKQIAFDAAQSGVEPGTDAAPTAAVAVGLALRRVGDR
jgi:type IV pilus assembly protein PilM